MTERWNARRSLPAALGLALAAAGCVTINIYFPAAAAERAADKIIDEVWQLQKDREAGARRDGPAGEVRERGAPPASGDRP